MANNLAEQISKLSSSKGDWVNLQGLVDCATSYLSSTGSSTNCLSISLLGRGSYNTVYRLAFSDAVQLAASVANYCQETFDAEGKLSEIETMKFVRESGLYPDIPVPKVHAWDTTFSNPACAPYVLMDVVEGEDLSKSWDPSTRLFGMDALPLAQQLSVVKALAKLKVALSRPVPFDRIGSITTDAAGGRQFIGPLITLGLESLGGPFKSIDEFWRSCIEEEILAMVEECFDPEEESEEGFSEQLPKEQLSEDRLSEEGFSENELPEEQRSENQFSEEQLSKDKLSEHQLSDHQEKLSKGQLSETQIPKWAVDPNDTPQVFAEMVQLLSTLIPQFTIPRAYSQLVLHHPDLALRNMLFDKESLSSGEPKITGVIDWGGAQVIPLMLTAQYPEDIRSSFSEPFTRSKYPGDNWNSVPFDWTSSGDPTQWPQAFSGEDGHPLDFTPRVAAAIGRFYLRTYFCACYVEQLRLLHRDTYSYLALGTLFADAPYYLKFHETVRGGLGKWLRHVDWIRETYWRLRRLTEQRREDGGESLIIGPNVYRRSMQPLVRDLGIFEELSCSENADGVGGIGGQSSRAKLFVL